MNRPLPGSNANYIETCYLLIPMLASKVMT